MKIETLWFLSYFGILCTFAQCPFDVYERVELVGGDYLAISTNINGCKYRCCDFDWCKGYSWTSNASTAGINRACIVGETCCYLKSSINDPPGTHKHKQIVSGVKSGCTTSFRPFIGKSLQGDNYESAPITQTECKNKCCASSTCQAYSWTAKALHAGISNNCEIGNKCCYLKSSQNGTVQNPPFFSGMKLSKCTESFSRFQKIDLPGSDLSSIADTDEITCKNICCHDQQCKAYSYTPKTKKKGVNNTCTIGSPCCNLKYDTPFYAYSQIHFGAYKNY